MHEASYTNQLINLKEWIKKNRTDDECVHFYALSLLDAAEESNEIERLAKEVLPPEWIEGDSYFVPSQVCIVEKLVEEIKRLRNK